MTLKRSDEKNVAADWKLMSTAAVSIPTLQLRRGRNKRRRRRWVRSFKNRKLIANGIFLSKLSYLIALWGGCNLNLLSSLQTLQNKAARIVTKLDWATPTSVLLTQCGWLSVHQLVVYHSVVMVFNVLQTKQPRPLHIMFPTDYPHNTSQARSNSIKQIGHPTVQHWTYGKTVSDGEQPDLSTNCQPVSRTFHLQKHSNWKLRNGSDPTLLCMAEVQTRDLGAAFLPPSFILDPGSQGWRF